MDFCEGGEGLICVWFIWEKVSAIPSPKMRPPLTPKKGKVPVLLSSLPNKSALVTDSEDDSDDNETFHDTETIPDEAHAPMPPSPLSPRRTCASGPDISTRATQTAATIAQPPAVRRGYG